MAVALATVAIRLKLLVHLSIVQSSSVLHSRVSKSVLSSIQYLAGWWLVASGLVLKRILATCFRWSVAQGSLLSGIRLLLRHSSKARCTPLHGFS